jgi:hypothetical protein
MTWVLLVGVAVVLVVVVVTQLREGRAVPGDPHDFDPVRPDPEPPPDD